MRRKKFEIVGEFVDLTARIFSKYEEEKEVEVTLSKTRIKL